jgi:hypothetical protein
VSNYEGDFDADLALVIKANAIRDNVLDEMERRGLGYTLEFWYYNSLEQETFFTLEDAHRRAEDDCVPTTLTLPDGRELDYKTNKYQYLELPQIQHIIDGLPMSLSGGAL